MTEPRGERGRQGAAPLGTFAEQMRELDSAFRDLGRTLFDVVSPALLKVADVLNRFARVFTGDYVHTGVVPYGGEWSRHQMRGARRLDRDRAAMGLMGYLLGRRHGAKARGEQ